MHGRMCVVGSPPTFGRANNQKGIDTLTKWGTTETLWDSPSWTATHKALPCQRNAATEELQNDPMERNGDHKGFMKVLTSLAWSPHSLIKITFFDILATNPTSIHSYADLTADRCTSRSEVVQYPIKEI